MDLGDGVVVGVHPSKPIAYVSIVDHQTKQRGCEGGEPTRLWAKPLDGGDAVRALPDSFVSGDVLTGGAEGRVAVVDQCEGFLSTLAVATPTAAGTFDDFHEVDTTAAETDGQLLPSTIRWSADGKTLLGIVHPNEAIERTIAVRISIDGTVQQLVDSDALLAVADLKDGTVVTATATSVTFGQATPIALDVTSIALAPDSTSIAVFGSSGVDVVGPDAGRRTITSTAASVGSWSPDGDLLAFLALAGDGAGVRVTDLDGRDVTATDHGGFGAPAFDAGRHFVVYNEAVDSGQGFAEPHARARALTSS
jgi:hypothetical protein